MRAVAFIPQPSFTVCYGRISPTHHQWTLTQKIYALIALGYTDGFRDSEPHQLRSRRRLHAGRLYRTLRFAGSTWIRILPSAI